MSLEEGATLLPADASTEAPPPQDFHHSSLQSWVLPRLPFDAAGSLDDPDARVTCS
jgi:hypothetical protein